MSKYVVKKCGLKFHPPSLMLIYEDTSQSKTRRRTIPVRDFDKSTNLNTYAQTLRTSHKHKQYLDSLPNKQLYKLLQILSDSLKGVKLEESLLKAEELTSINPEEDLNKVDDDILTRKKAIMNDSFEKNCLKPEDANYSYDVEVDFAAVVETSGWDSGSDDEDF